MSTVEIASVIRELQDVRDNVRIAGFRDQQFAEQIGKLKAFLRRLNDGELEIRLNRPQ